MNTFYRTSVITASFLAATAPAFANVESHTVSVNTLPVASPALIAACQKPMMVYWDESTVYASPDGMKAYEMSIPDFNKMLQENQGNFHFGNDDPMVACPA